ncbi:hypothetical protein IV48_GL000295 [Fructilactobacillus fructivorans]|nr:hypothetical protein IV51_GL001370 [Fructilactobacillus fructivorans]KRN42427.1 hypothetical protein IV48_GL000295 [Fructilactobacillus fructivorans]
MEEDSDMNKYEKFRKEHSDSPFWGIELLRDSLLPDLLDQDIHDILYWAGKDLATKFPVASNDDLQAFFKQSQFGNLELKKENIKKISWKLSGPKVETRLKLNKDPDFMLEAGFLAQTKQQIDQISTECEATIKLNSVNFTVVSDPNAPVNNPSDFKTINIAK